MQDLLSAHEVVVIAGHSEYWSVQMFENLKRYVEAGGNVLMMSGNSMYWRSDFQLSPQLLIPTQHTSACLTQECDGGRSVFRMVASIYPQL